MTEQFDLSKPHFERIHPVGNGFQKIWKFKNGYGASVVRFSLLSCYGSYTDNENEFELAVIRFTNSEKTEDFCPPFELDYDTPITSDVIGHLSEKEVIEILNKISELAGKELIEDNQLKQGGDTNGKD